MAATAVDALSKASARKGAALQKMQIPYSRNEKMAGVFVIFGLIMVFLSAAIVGGGRDWFSRYNEYFVLYEQGYGLAPGVKVKFLRTDIGQVTELELTGNNMVKVHVKVLEEYASRIRIDSQAAIQSPTLIGSEFIDIMPGTSDEIIPAGGQIPAKPRKSLDDIIASLKLEEKLHQIESIMANVDSLTKPMQDPNGPLLGTMSNVRHMTAMVSSGEGSLGRLVAQDEVYEELQRILTGAAEVSQNLAKTAADINKSTPDLLKKLDANLTSLQSMTAQLDKSISAVMPELTRSAREITRSARESLKDVNQVLESAKRNILIRGNLPPQEEPTAVEYPVRQKQR